MKAAHQVAIEFIAMAWISIIPCDLVAECTRKIAPTVCRGVVLGFVIGFSCFGFLIISLAFQDLYLGKITTSCTVVLHAACWLWTSGRIIGPDILVLLEAQGWEPDVFGSERQPVV